MRTAAKFLAIGLSASLAAASLVSPASATGVHPPIPPKVITPGGSGGSGAGIILCPLGAAFGAIFAAAAKGAANGNPTRLIPQWEWDRMTPQQQVPYPLTNAEAGKITFSCGLLTGPVVAGFKKKSSSSTPVVAKY